MFMPHILILLFVYSSLSHVVGLQILFCLSLPANVAAHQLLRSCTFSQHAFLDKCTTLLDWRRPLSRLYRTYVSVCWLWKCQHKSVCVNRNEVVLILWAFRGVVMEIHCEIWNNDILRPELPLSLLNGNLCRVYTTSWVLKMELAAHSNQPELIQRGVS